jgi:hypothetical protein
MNTPVPTRQWSTEFFKDEMLPPEDSSPPGHLYTWPSRGQVLWIAGQNTPNELNQRNFTGGTLPQPEPVAPGVTDVIPWSLYVPSVILAADRSSTPPAIIPVTLLLGRGDEEVGYGLRVFFERAGTGALFVLGGREGGAGGDPGGRWNVGISQRTIEKIFSGLSLRGTPQIRVMAGYSTGYGICQTINNDLVPLAPVRRFVLFDCIYRCDSPPLPTSALPPALAPGDRPPFTAPAGGQVILTEVHKEPLRPVPFNMRRAITKLRAASPSCQVVGYSATPGGSPRYCIWTADRSKIVTPGIRPVVEMSSLVEFRTATASPPGSMPVTQAYDTLLLARYIKLGLDTRLVAPADLSAMPAIKDAISVLPPRGTVAASSVTSPMISTPTAALPGSMILLPTWAAGLPSRLSQPERNAAAKLLRDHLLVLPGWTYGYDDLDEFRHAGALAEFGWELLPP